MSLEEDITILRECLLRSMSFESIVDPRPPLTPEQEKLWEKSTRRLILAWDVPPWLVDKKYDTSSWRLYWKFRVPIRWIQKKWRKLCG